MRHLIIRHQTSGWMQKVKHVHDTAFASLFLVRKALRRLAARLRDDNTHAVRNDDNLRVLAYDAPGGKQGIVQIARPGHVHRFD